MDTRVTCDARPTPISFDPHRTAVIVIDMQNDFGTPGGMFDSAGINIAPIRQIVKPIAAVLDEARAAGMVVIYTKQEHSPDLSDAGGPSTPHWVKHQRIGLGREGTAPDGSPTRVLVRDTWNTAIVPDLTPKPGDLVVGKHRFNAFHGTALDSILRGRGIETLVFVGATTSICVESTLRDAMFRDYFCIILEDCTAEPIAHEASRSNHDATILNIEVLFGWVADSAKLRNALHANEPA